MTTFYYTITALLDLIKEQASYKAKLLSKIEGGPSFEDASISNDENDLVKQYLRSITSEIFDKHLSPLSRTLEETPFEFDVTYDPGTGDINNCIVFRVEFPEKFDQKTIPAVTRAIEETIVSYAILQWFKDNKFERQTEEQEHTLKKKNLISSVNRRIGLVRKPGTVF